MGLLPSTSVLATTRASGINLPNAAGVYQTLGINTLPRTDLGLYANGQFVQSAVNWDAPANETISLGTGTFTLAVWGGGSIAVAAGTATGSGFGTATDGSPVTFTISGAGTISLTVTGSPDYVNVTSTAFAPPAPQETGTIEASDIRGVQGARPSNSQAEPFAGWEAAGLDDNLSVLVDLNSRFLSAGNRIAYRLNNASAQFQIQIDTSSAGNNLRLNVAGAGNSVINFPGGQKNSRTRVAFRLTSDGGYAVAQKGEAISTGSLVTPWGGNASATMFVGNSSGAANWNDWIYELQICKPLSDAALLDWVNA